MLRHGNDNRVEGNYLLAGSNGIRIYGNDHLIVNNYIERIGGAGHRARQRVGPGSLRRGSRRSPGAATMLRTG